MIGALALIAAAAAAVWLLMRAGRGVSGDARNVTILKLVVWLGIAGALFAAKLFPLALMILLAAGGVTAIEIWRTRAIKETGASVSVRTGAAMTREQAASVLGVDENATSEDVRAAHRKLIGQLHPDKGGTDYLAAQINEARDVMLKSAAKPMEENTSDDQTSSS